MTIKLDSSSVLRFLFLLFVYDEKKLFFSRFFFQNDFKSFNLSLFFFSYFFHFNSTGFLVAFLFVWLILYNGCVDFLNLRFSSIVYLQ